MKKEIKAFAKAIRTTSRKLRGKERRYVFERKALSGENCDAQQILNLLNYTKTSGSPYNGQDFPAGYHTLDIKNFHLAGQRHPKERFGLVPFDFTGKTVLDIGSNQGGMLFNIADKISHGVGIDYDRRVVNAANRIRSYTETRNLDFYVFDLEKDDLALIEDFLPGGRVDIVFLLAVCMWTKNWKSVIDVAAKVSKNILFESNGDPEQQKAQIAYLGLRYKYVKKLSDQSLDDKSQQMRQLFLCKR